MNFSTWVLSPAPYSLRRYTLQPSSFHGCLSEPWVHSICPNWGSPKSVHFLVSDFWGNSGCYQQILYPKGQHTVFFCVISGKKMACLSTASPTSAAKFEWACVEQETPCLSIGLPFWKQNLNSLPVSGYHKVEPVCGLLLFIHSSLAPLYFLCGFLEFSFYFSL